ncbi:MAG: glycosyltransferase family 2 protein [Candidatus Omnitrophica bacterium]|nr:glycosyltransferase family 2 protein [Candidatus Omnitrophota bacterium]
MDNPRLSVIVPTHNSQRILEPCLAAVRESHLKDYELIVVDDASTDASRSIARRYADQVIELQGHEDRSRARNTGMRVARGSIFVFIDSDIVIQQDTLGKIDDYFTKHPGVDALTGLLSKQHPHSDFFSQYKNLYMHYVFQKLPARVNFLYGSVSAFKRGCMEGWDDKMEMGEDTALGQKMAAAGKCIHLFKGLEVVHLKKYSLVTFIRNDFRIPFAWAKIFLRYQGWRQLFRHQTGFAHASKGQILSVVLAPMIFLGGMIHFPMRGSYLALAFLIWFVLNLNFFRFLVREKGIAFGIFSVLVTFLDHLVMAFGIVSGAVAFLGSMGVGSQNRLCNFNKD